jgi:hypothetical protein
VPVSELTPWRQRVVDALLVVSFLLIGFFSASGDAAADRDTTGMQKTGAPKEAS